MNKSDTRDINVNPMSGGCGFSEIIYYHVTGFCGNPKSIIELGCGNGGNLSRFKDTAKKVGIDPYTPNVQAAKGLTGVIKGSHNALGEYRQNEFAVGFTVSVLDHIGGVNTVTKTLRMLTNICKKVILLEPYVEGIERQFVRGEVKAYRNTWLHDYDKMLSLVGLTHTGCPLKWTITSHPLYKTNSGPYFHLFEVTCS